ncbi:plastocyanin/azurin family copper-binding protein [Thiohalomonas denitrificans]|uniref:Copper binding protein, plastocyanin/azurin family n=1 Tax=Thiohalomonas denitrificans TaxID=415747 RepID=A0A1G5Q973_9GAMM|nr:plastocyanin/azurin family copper-binding protein [Thiohalomonas denitrificans]SCZ58202.1 Copper binding protein, plastocyanin/azurin family [Thiohalomonas denitrificans]
MRTSRYWILLSLLIAGSSLADTVTVEIKGYQFIPEEVTVKPGDTVQWVNREKRQYHSVWFEELGEPESDYFFPGESTSRQFTQVGSFPYRCGPHPEMTGVVNVEE